MFECNGHGYAVTRFLCVLKNIRETQDGWYDISVVESQIGERLTDNEDLIGVEITFKGNSYIAFSNGHTSCRAVNQPRYP